LGKDISVSADVKEKRGSLTSRQNLLECNQWETKRESAVLLRAEKGWNLMKKEHILIIKTAKRRDTADSIQKALTEFGCIIQMRLGLHEAGDRCSDEGLLLLQLTDDAAEAAKLEAALKQIPGVVFQSVEI